MDRRPSPDGSARAGLVVLLLVAVTAIGWAAGWALVAVPAALGVVGAAASAAGVDSREPGDWPRIGP